MADSPEEIRKSMKKYLAVMGVLFIGTVLTVAVAVFEPFDVGARGFSTGDLVIGLLIASVKASLVMYIFMHLNDEKKLIYIVYAMSIVFALFLFFLTRMAFKDPINYPGFGLGKPVSEKVDHH